MGSRDGEREETQQLGSSECCLGAVLWKGNGTLCKGCRLCSSGLMKGAITLKRGGERQGQGRCFHSGLPCAALDSYV